MSIDVDIVVVGSCNLDLVVGVDHVPRVGETVLGGDLVRVPGGKGANQAVAAARLGRRVAMVGRVGDDDAGMDLQRSLMGAGVDISALVTTAGVPTGVALIAVQDDGDNAIVVSPGANARLTPDDIASADVVGRASALLMQAEVPLDTLVAAAASASGLVVWNPAPVPAEVPAALLEMVDILVPNQTELAALCGFDGFVDLEVASQLARALPVSAVVVTLGAEGALVVTDRDAVHVRAPAVVPVDTTAAGDAFCAALTDRLVGGAGVVDAATWAVRVGAATTLRQGAQPSLPTAAEVEERLG